MFRCMTYTPTQLKDSQKHWKQMYNVLEDKRYEQMSKTHDEIDRPAIDAELKQSRLFSSIKTHDLTAVTSCINNGFNINEQNVNLLTPVMCAITHKDVPILNLLLENGADVSLTNNEGNNALHVLCIHAGHPDMVDSLMKHKADINAKNNQGYTPLMLAINPDNTSLMAKLIAHGATIPTLNELASVDYPEYLNLEKIDYLLQKAIEKAKNNDFDIKPVRIRKTRRDKALEKQRLEQLAQRYNNN